MLEYILFSDNIFIHTSLDISRLAGIRGGGTATGRFVFESPTGEASAFDVIVTEIVFTVEKSDFVSVLGLCLDARNRLFAAAGSKLLI